MPALPDPLPATAPPGFHVLAKPTGPICNLDCRYCFFLSKEALYPGDRFRMPEAVHEAYVRQLLEAHTVPEVTLAWQGGEPTLMGVDFFRRTLELVDRYRRPDQRVHHAIQTNGTLLTDEWCDLFAENDFLVGISLDGPPELHDTYRVDKRGDPTYARVRRGWELLAENGVDVNILCTVHAANQDHPLEVYRYFRDELGAGFVQFIPIVERVEPAGSHVGPTTSDGVTDRKAQVTDRTVDPEAWGRFLLAVFDEWVRRDVGSVFVQHFDSALASWVGAPQSLCVFRETCGDAVALEHNGDLYSCDHFVDPDHLLGNITSTHLVDLLASPRQRAFGQAKADTLADVCRRCPVLFACQGECPRNRLRTGPDGEETLNYLCAGFLAFFTGIDGLMGLMAERVRAGGHAGEVMEVLASAPRNAPCPCGRGRKAKHCHGAR